jgi:hypothetical protein
MVWGFGLNMVVGTGVFAIVTFAMFGSAMIPHFLSNGGLLQLSRRVSCHRQTTQAGDALRFLGAGLPCSIVKGLPDVDQEHAVHGIPRAGRSRPDRSYLLFWFSKPGISEY